MSEEKINDLLEPFRAFGAAFIIQDVEDFGQYGLDDPVCTIRLSTEDRDYEIKLGDYSKMDSQRYVSIGDGNVYLAKHDPLDEFNATIRNLIDHDEVPELDRVTGISFSGAEHYSVTYEEEGANPYREEDVYFARQNGKSLPLDTDRVRDYLDYLEYLNLTDYVTYNAAEEELEIDGFRNALEALTADEFTGEKPSGKEEISLTLSLDREGAGEVQITLYRHDGEHCISAVDGESVCLVKRAAAVELIEAVHAIVLD